MTPYIGRVYMLTGNEVRVGDEWLAFPPALRRDVWGALGHEAIVYARGGVVARVCVQRELPGVA